MLGAVGYREFGQRQGTARLVRCEWDPGNELIGTQNSGVVWMGLLIEIAIILITGLENESLVSAPRLHDIIGE